MNIINIPKKGNSTTIGIVVPVGSRMEEDRVKGISHFIEHMLFKGTRSRNCKEIAFEIERYGGILNAFTDYEITCYWVKIENKHKDIAIDVLTDMLLHPLFAQKEIDKEREVIRQEINMYEDNPTAHLEDVFNKRAFKSGSFKIGIAGTGETIDNINREEILKYYRTNYRPELMTLIVVGDVKEKAKFHNPLLFLTPVHNFNDVSNKKLSTHFEKRNDITQSNIKIGNYIKVKQMSLTDAHACDLLTSVYNDMSGRLFTEIREKNNLVYHIGFNCSMYSDSLLKWEVDLGLDKKNIKKAHNIIVRELIKPVNKIELDYAVSKLIGDNKLWYDDTRHIMETVAYCVHENFNYKEYIFNYEKHIREAAKNIDKYIKKLNFKKNMLVGVIPK